SHATCYSWIAYQTAYLKAHYPSEYMAAVLSRNRSNIKEITKAMDECKAMGIQVLGPDVNESVLKFGVNKQGDIRFGLGAIKGVGGNIVDNILEVRQESGPFKDIFDFIERLNIFTCNKRVLDSLALAGAFDNLNIRREPIVTPGEKGETFSEILLHYGHKYHSDKASAQHSLFDGFDSIEIARPPIPACMAWSDLERLNKEKEYIGIYLSAHPLDEYRIILNHICNTTMADIGDLTALKGKELQFGGIVIGAREGVSRNGKPYMILRLEDFSGSGEIPLFGNDFIEYGKYGKPGVYLLVKALVQPRQWKESELEIKIKSVQQLQDVKDDLIKKIKVTLPANKLDDQIINELSVFIKNNPGKTQLYFTITDREHQVHLNLFSRSVRLTVTQDLIDFINETAEMEFTINK
ncbi:MAG: DNA polymerase III subunit alpha, partial [Tannerella sp.]|nr:DNA polymerase III subunit alpha [Tannerella sp.]